MIPLSPTQQQFILHWGEMGTRWGINRTVAQVHALLYLAAKPLPADEIVEALGVARSNVSTSLKELQSWQIVKVVHVLGDRRDHFESLHDVFEMFRIIVEERKRREVDPTLVMLRECVAAAGDEPAVTRQRMEQMLQFFEISTRWYDQMKGIPTGVLLKVMKLGNRAIKLLQLGR